MIGLVALLFVVRPMTKRRRRGAAEGGSRRGHCRHDRSSAPAHRRRVESEIDAEMDAALAAKAGEGRRLPVLTRRAVGIAQKEPENTAKLIRSWMAE